MKIYTPGSLTEVQQILKKDPRARPLAGGTDLLLKRKDNAVLIDLSRLEGQLKGIEVGSDRLQIGALTTFAELKTGTEIKDNIPALFAAANDMGSVQIRNRATLGGNIAGISPAADSLPPLLAHRAAVKVMEEEGQQSEISLEEYLKWQESSHLVLSVLVPVVSGQSIFSYFQKIGTRKKVSIARLNAGVRAIYNPQQKIVEELWIFLGALALKPFRASKAEGVIKGKKIEKVNKKEFLDRLTAVVDTAIPGRYSQPYKRIAIRGLGEDIFSALEKEVLS